jgi:hypothetical protein
MALKSRFGEKNQTKPQWTLEQKFIRVKTGKIPK